MKNIEFIKMHGIGNDFVIIEKQKNLIELSRKDFLKKIGSRNFGIGCDQILIINNYNKKVAEISIYNNDGSEVGACGNGVRCIAFHLMKKQGIKSIQIKTISDNLNCWIENENCFVNMGKPVFEWNKIPLAQNVDVKNLKIDQFNLVCLSMGNPHAVIFFKSLHELNKVDIEHLGRKIQKEEIFPESVNVEFATVLENKTIRMQVWERGAGRTLACGSGACATLVAAHQKNLSNRKNDIILDGGKLTIDWLKNDDVIMSGKVTFVYEGKFFYE